MVSREEHQQIISSFIVELNRLLLHIRPEDIHALPRFEKDMGQYISDLRDPTKEPFQALYTAFGLVDEFIHADRERILTTAYEAHQVGEGNRSRSEA